MQTSIAEIVRERDAARREVAELRIQLSRAKEVQEQAAKLPKLTSKALTGSAREQQLQSEVNELMVCAEAHSAIQLADMFIHR